MGVLWPCISRPWSYVMVLRIAAGSRFSTAEKLSATALEVALSILASTTKPGGALDQRADRGAVASALDQVAFPVTRNEAILDLCRADMDALHVLDLVTPIVDSTARLAHLVVVPEGGNQRMQAWTKRRCNGVCWQPRSARAMSSDPTKEVCIMGDAKRMLSERANSLRQCYWMQVSLCRSTS